MSGSSVKTPPLASSRGWRDGGQTYSEARDVCTAGGPSQDEAVSSVAQAVALTTLEGMPRRRSGQGPPTPRSSRSSSLPQCVVAAPNLSEVKRCDQASMNCLPARRSFLDLRPLAFCWANFELREVIKVLCLAILRKAAHHLAQVLLQ